MYTSCETLLYEFAQMTHLSVLIVYTGAYTYDRADFCCTQCERFACFLIQV